MSEQNKTITLTPAELLALYDIFADISDYVNGEMFTVGERGVHHYFKIFGKISSQMPKNHGKVEFQKFKEFYNGTEKTVGKSARKV